MIEQVTIAVDPGQTGAIAFRFPSGVIAVYPMPVDDKAIDLEKLKTIVRGHQYACAVNKDCRFVAWIEKAQPMAYSPANPLCPICAGKGRTMMHGLNGWMKLPCTCRRRQGLVSSFHFAEGAGLVRGCLIGMDIDCHKVSARTWQRVMLPAGTPRGRQHVKAASIAAVRARYPKLSLRRTSRCKVDSPDMADAVNIADYGSRITAVA